MTTHRLPRAVPDGEPTDLDGVLAAVRRTAAELLAASPVPPSTLNVRAGAVSVELAWTPGEVDTRHTHGVATQAPPTQPAAVPAPAVAVPAPAGETINAATVGVFYRAPSPGAPPFVAEGDEVGRGQQVAVIEAMKLMLPVEADRAGRVTEVLVSDGEAVEYGQPLFRLAAAGEGLGTAA